MSWVCAGVGMGPEAVFRRVELGEPRRSAVLLRAPELVVGFDVWQTLRSGQLEAARITLVAADIDLSRSAARTPGEALAAGRARGQGGASSVDGAGRAGDGVSTRGSARGRNAPDGAPTADGVRLLEGWQGGRVDLEGGTLRLADPGGSPNPLVLQIRRASLRRAELSSAPASEASSGHALGRTSSGHAPGPRVPPSGVATASSFCPSGWDARHAWCCVSTVTWSDPQG